jgi:hypothetical protein
METLTNVLLHDANEVRYPVCSFLVVITACNTYLTLMQEVAMAAIPVLSTLCQFDPLMEVCFSFLLYFIVHTP